MPRKPTPWFPIYAKELLCDEKIAELTNEELGILLKLWCKMWDNGVKRGTLLLTKTKPISDEKIAEFLGVTSEKFQEILFQLFSNLHIIKRGKFGELFSVRLRNFKTKWELYSGKKKNNGNETETKKKPKRKITERNRKTESESESSSEPESEINNKKNPASGDFNKLNLKEIQNQELEDLVSTWRNVFVGSADPEYSQLQLLIYGAKGSGKDCFEEAPILKEAILSLKGKDIKTPFLYLKKMAKDPLIVHNMRKKAEQKTPSRLKFEKI